MTKLRFLIITICAFVTAFALTFVTRQCTLSSGIAGHTVSPLPEPIPAAARSLRSNFPYSVISGGAYSPAELRFANDKDPLVREHYADFNMRVAKLVMLTDDRYQYVSFRLKNHIFWTRNKLRIPKGEILLTDGQSYARTRCGNRLSSTRQANTTPLQPSELVLSLPSYSPRLLAQLPLEFAPPAGELAQEFPLLPFESERLAPVLPYGTEASMELPENWGPVANYAPIVPISGGYIPTDGRKTSPPGVLDSSTTPISSSSPPRISQVPEPASFYLFTISFTVSLWLLTRIMRNRESKNKRSKEGQKPAAPRTDL